MGKKAIMAIVVILMALTPIVSMADGGSSNSIDNEKIIRKLNKMLAQANGGQSQSQPPIEIATINGVGYQLSRSAVTTGAPGVAWISVTGADGKNYSIFFGNKNVVAPDADITPIDSTENTMGSMFGDQFVEAWQALADEGNLDTSDPWLAPVLSSASNILTYVPYVIKGNAPAFKNPGDGKGSYVAFNDRGKEGMKWYLAAANTEDDSGKSKGKGETSGGAGDAGIPAGMTTAVNFGAAEAVIDFGTEVKNAVVIRQDPEQRGADVYVTLRSCPVVYHYIEKQTYTTERCIYSATPPSDWNGCEPGHKGDKHWHKIVETHVRYVQRSQTVKDPVNLRDYWDLSAHLSRLSRQWIAGELEARYYLASIVKPDWDLSRIPSIRVVSNYYDANGCNVVRIGVTRIPFVDPGWYDTEAEFYSTGTRFTPPPGVSIAKWPDFIATYPKVMRDKKPLHVWMLDETLVK